MTAEIVILEKYRKEKINRPSKISISKSETKSDTSKSISLHASSEKLHNFENGEPI
jgi:hypothetical protein